MARQRMKIRDAAKIVREGVADWTAENPRKAGESKAAYRKRCRDALESQFRGEYGDWTAFFEMIMQLLQILLPLLIV